MRGLCEDSPAFDLNCCRQTLQLQTWGDGSSAGARSQAPFQRFGVALVICLLSWLQTVSADPARMQPETCDEIARGLTHTHGVARRAPQSADAFAVAGKHTPRTHVGGAPRRLPRLPSTGARAASQGACATAAATQQRAVLAQSPHPSTRFPKRSPPASRTPAFITLDDPKNSCPPQVRRVDGSGRRRPIGIPARTFLATCGTTALFFCGECKKL